MNHFDGHLSKFSDFLEKRFNHIVKPRTDPHGHHSHACKSRAEIFRFDDSQHHNPRHIKIPHNAHPKQEIKIAHIEILGDVLSQNTRVKRDLGFQGRLGDYVILSYGDNMFRDEDGSDRFIGMTCNAAGIACADPTQVFDPLLDQDGRFPCCLIEPSKEFAEDISEYAVGITNVIETSHGKGLVYFLLNHRPTGVNNIIGAGVAQVTLATTTSAYSTHPLPTLHTHRPSRTWWNGETEPWYGDICSVRVETSHSDHIYAYGHAKDNPWIYLCRAPTHLAATDLEAYEYWNGKTWQRERLSCSSGDDSTKLGETQSVFWQIQQGQVVWSTYHSCFIFVYCDAWWTNQVLIKTSTAPEGPWSEPTTVYKAELVQKDGGCIYSAVPHPYYDPRGKTLVVTFTNHPNTIQAIKVTFE